MAIFLTESSRLIVQGMTGSEGSKHTGRFRRHLQHRGWRECPKGRHMKVDFVGSGAAGIRLCREATGSPARCRRAVRAAARPSHDTTGADSIITWDPERTTDL